MPVKECPPSKFLAAREALLVTRLGPDAHERVKNVARATFAELLSTAPRFKSMVNRKLFEYAVPCLAMYKALRGAGGCDEKDALAIMGDIVDAAATGEIEGSRWRRFLLRAMGRSTATGRYYERTLSRLDEPHGWQALPVPPGERPPGAVIAFDMTRCGMHAYFTTQGAPELGPILCRADAVAARYMKGVRFERTRTIANGDDVCDFRYVLDA